MGDGVTEWLERRGFARFAPLFREHEIELDILCRLTEEDLKEIGLPLGPRRAIVLAIAEMSGAPADAAPPEPASGPAPEPAGEPLAERRQLSIAFFDMVGSTALAVRFDPEDLRELMRLFLETIAGVVRRYDGYIARYLGDGVLVLFGWPRAFEDQAERAVLAALDAVAAVRALEPDLSARLDLRVGIATGRVVVGDAGDDVDNVTGDAPNRAQRLQALAEPGGVVIDEPTHRSVGSLFAVEPLGPVAAKGFPEPLPAWAVRGASMAPDDRFEVSRSVLTPFSGRAGELALLAERWAIARAGEGQVLILEGEAGIGKSRLVKVLQGSLAHEPHHVVRFQCIDYHSNSALYPAVQVCRRLAALDVDDDAVRRFEKLEAAIKPISPDPAKDVPLLAHLLSLPVQPPYEPVSGTGQAVREGVVEALMGLLVHRSMDLPLLVIVEDAHWIDPSTLELLVQFATRIAEHRILLVVTTRPDGPAPLPRLANGMRLLLNRITREQSVRIALDNGGHALPPAALKAVVDRADGVPLYVEELTKAVLHSASGGEVPTSIRSLFVARLDGLGRDKPLAQLLSVLGRTFSWDFMRLVAGADEAQLEAALERLIASGLLLRRGGGTEAHYRFKHALIQEVAYGTLLFRTRRDIHGRVADALLTDFAGLAEGEPESVARHLSLAERPAEAVAFWRRAGERLAERSAHREAAVQFEAGLADLAKMPPSRERNEAEFALRIGLAAALLTVEGWSAPQVAMNYEAALRLGDEAGDPRKLFVALRGQANVFFLNGELAKTQTVIDQFSKIAAQSDDTELLIEAHRANGMCALLGGDFLRARDYLERANALYDRRAHHSMAFIYGTDPGVVGLAGLSWAHWFLGETAKAETCSRQAIQLAKDTEHPFSLAYAEGFRASLCQFRGEARAAKRHAERAIAVSQEHRFRYWAGWGKIVRGWAVARLGKPHAGLAEVEEGIAVYESTGARQILPYARALLAECRLLAGTAEPRSPAAVGPAVPAAESDINFYSPPGGAGEPQARPSG